MAQRLVSFVLKWFVPFSVLISNAGCTARTARQPALPPSPTVVPATPSAPVAALEPHLSGPSRAVTADTDPAQTRDGVGKPPSEAPDWCSRAFGAGVHCRLLARGPLYVTDALPSGRDCAGQAVAVLREGRVRMQFDDLRTLRATRFFVTIRDELVLVQEAAPAVAEVQVEKRSKIVSPADPVAPDPRFGCGIYWSGFAPYGTRPSSDVEVAEQLDY